MEKEKRNIQWIVTSRMISRVGDIMFDVANNTFFVGINPRSLSLVAIYQSLESLIGILFNLFGGVFADNFRRKKILVASNVFCGLACLLISLISIEKWLVYAIILTNVFLAFMNAFSGPSYKAFTKEIVSQDSITRLNSLLETTSTMVKVSIPMIALFFYKKIGINGVLLLDGLSFLLAALMLFFIVPINEEVSRKEKMSLVAIFDDLKIGFRYVYQHKTVFLIILLSALVNFFLAAYNLLLPYSSQVFTGLSDKLYGSFLTAEAIGGFIGAMLSSFVNKELSSKSLMRFLALSGLMLVLSAPLYFFFHHTLLLAVSPALFSLFLAIFNIQFFSIVQRDVDNQFLGRVFGIIFTVAILFMPIGTGFFSAILNPRNTYNFCWIGTAVCLLALVFEGLFKRYEVK
ncbi:MFS transporter [Atopobacter sp. AH10]|uniref:MFS transporter n=1 Tax=Atopobacter sp. AH10 TaxID=2315861 RepID=UPI000EF249C1|nr:MFS transporter [Atopobacter sp. AH10]RLK62678.1 MFS transporter [Atopobacter sp. AH10]